MSTANKTQHDQWNAESQVTSWPKREHVTNFVTPVLLDALALRPGESVVDIGCGGGLQTFEAARAVGASGRVTGFDFSGPLVGLAKERATAAGIGNVTFVVGDAQTHAIPGSPFDVATSQFGVMFFADPVAAFSNIRAHLRPGGRLAFACWQPAAKNPWFPGSVLSQYQAPPAPAAGGGPPPSPFALGDPEYAERILTGAGFEGISCTPLSLEVAVPEEAVADRETVATLRLDDATAARAWAELQAHAKAMRGSDGLLHFTIAPQIVRASNPG